VMVTPVCWAANWYASYRSSACSLFLIRSTRGFFWVEFLTGNRLCVSKMER